MSNLLFTGDCAMQTNFFTADPVGQQIKTLISKSDTTIVNLEAAVPAGPPVPKSGPNIGADERLFHTLSTLGVDAATIANNHSMDFGSAGLQDTIQTCRDNSIDSFGAGTTQSESLEPFERQVGNSTVGIFGLSEHEIGIAGRNELGVCWIRSLEVLTQLQSGSQEFDVSIVIAHGGSSTSHYRRRLGAHSCGLSRLWMLISS